MLNLLGFMLVLLMTFAGEKSGVSPNPLINLSIVLIYGYCLALAAQRLKLPRVTGYILAGILIRHESLGIISREFTEDSLLIEHLAIMLMVSILVRSLFYRRDLRVALKDVFQGSILSVTAIITGSIVAYALTRDMRPALMFGLLASLTSPLLVHGMTRDATSNTAPASTISAGAFVVSFIMWSLAAGIFHHTGVIDIRLVVMPLILGLTSFVAGFVWAFVCERLFISTSTVNHFMYPVAVLFLLYPLEHALGLDLLFLSAGVGLFNGLSSNRTLMYTETSPLAQIIVFVYLGTRIPIDTLVTIPREQWTLILFLFLLISITRYLSCQISSLILGNHHSYRPQPGAVLLFGPLSMLVLSRFLPAFSLDYTLNLTPYNVYSYLLITTFIGVCIYCLTLLSRNS